MHTKFTPIFVLLGIFATMLGCENPAASGTVEVIIQNVSPQDIDPRGGLLYAVAAVNSGACVEGPCSPNPCLGDLQGKTACVGMGDQAMCKCPAGTHEDTESGTGQCIPDVGCLPTTCNRPGAGTCMDEGGVLSCMCAVGFTGSDCTECDASAGLFPDGLGGCTADPGDICRDGQGTAAFKKILTDAEAELGHPPTELELSSARMEINGTPQGVRSWDYLYKDEVTLFVQTVSGFPSNAGVLTIPPTEAGLEPLEFDMNVTRATTSSDNQFFSGDFRIGLSGPTERQLTESFSADIKLVLDFSAY